MTTLTGNLRQIDPNAAYAIVTLVGCGSAMPKVSGSGLISQQTLKIAADAGGNISQTILGNDVIVPSGTAYVVSLHTAAGGWLSTRKYLITGSSANLDELSPL